MNISPQDPDDDDDDDEKDISPLITLEQVVGAELVLKSRPPNAR